MNSREAIEYFHLSFCQRLSAKVDRKLFCLKGGCNLRFYFRSFRYSEDIDFDVHTVSVKTLQKNVENILGDGTFKALLRHKEIEVTEWSAPKQTETTQRWKAAFRIGNQSFTVPTKLEFSRRLPKFAGSAVEPVDTHHIEHYQLQSIVLPHYQAAAAMEQKIGALIGRAETQARDVIDLKILKDKLAGPLKFTLAKAEKEKALETLMSISFADYKSQVWPYLISELQEYYAGKKIWEELQGEILKLVEKIPVKR